MATAGTAHKCRLCRLSAYILLLSSLVLLSCTQGVLASPAAPPSKDHDTAAVLAAPPRHHHQQRAQFWAGWPRTTLTLVATVTQTVPTIPVGDSATVEETTTIFDTAMTGQPSGTLTVFATTTTVTLVSTTTTTSSSVAAGTGGITTVFTTTTSSSQPLSRTTATSTPTRSGLTPSATYGPAVYSEGDIPRFARCNPGDENYEEPGTLSLTQEQRVTLIAIAIIFPVILIGWNFVIIRYLLYPLKMVVLFIHEGGHAIPGVLGGNPLERVYTDPVDGGLCSWNGPWPKFAIPLGYLFSALVGATFILCGFNTEASKVASFFIGLLLLLAAYQVYTSPLGLVLVVATTDLMIGFWFIEHARYLRFFVLFVGVMSCFYLIWDFLDDWVFHKLHPCCLILHRDYLGFLQPFIWLYIWLAITSIIFAGFILIAIVVFRQSPHSMFCQGQSFLPT